MLGDEVLRRELAGAVVEVASSRFEYTHLTTTPGELSCGTKTRSEVVNEDLAGDLGGDDSILYRLVVTTTSLSPDGLRSLPFVAAKYAAAAASASPVSPFVLTVGADKGLTEDAANSTGGRLATEEPVCNGGKAKEGDEATPFVSGRLWPLEAPLEAVRCCKRRKAWP